MSVKRLLIPALLIAAGLLLVPQPRAEQASREVLVLEVRGTIDPALAKYVHRGLEEARRSQAAAVVIQLDTPGGMDGSMRKIMQGILNSPVPVIVFVSPQGARAASAGAFITLAAHVAAMAPGTNIGAAHPVNLGGGAEKDGKPSVMDAKITNDAVAYIRSIAELRGRNPAWAANWVTDSASSAAEEAKAKGAIDLVAADMDQLLDRVEGREVTTVFGATTLSTRGLPRRSMPMLRSERLLHQLAHPNLAYILLLLGIYGMIYELSTPGTVFPGVIGAILLVLALVALETLEVNWAGLALILLAVIFFIADVKLPGYGALTAGGIVAFVLGSILLFPGARAPHLRLPWATIGAAGATTAVFSLLVVGAGVRALRRKVASGAEALIGASGVAKTDLRPAGIVHVQGEDWKAHAARAVKKGARVRVVKLEGLTVHVEPESK